MDFAGLTNVVLPEARRDTRLGAVLGDPFRVDFALEAFAEPDLEAAFSRLGQLIRAPIAGCS